MPSTSFSLAIPYAYHRRRLLRSVQTFPDLFDNKLALYECTRNTTLSPHIGAFLAALEDYTSCIPTPRCFTAGI